MADAPKYLSRAEMEAIVKNKGGVLFNGEVITELSKLPTEADLAQHDESRRTTALANIAERKKMLEAEEAKLLAEPVVKAPPPPAAPAESKRR